MLHPNNINPDDNEPKQAFKPIGRNTFSTQNMNETTIYSQVLDEYRRDLIHYLVETYNMTYLNLPNGIDYGFGCIARNIKYGP